ncbi:ABC transporter substrate-binding protein [Propioniciclava soli]|uniref:ABC transporter substrate-binding protein n=1 Tax=Propioniciclava soli TaxID=2775081 RepID=UPI001E3843E0|nr:extracellular solute-binding protein [Propioniciclava soli]
MHRRFAAAVITACLALGACAGPGGADAEGGPVTLRMAWWGNDLRNRMTEEVIALFHEQHPDIRVELEPGEWSGYWDRLATQAAGGDLPDVIAMDESQIATYGNRGVLLDLASQSANLDLSAMDANVLETGMVDGVLAGAPVGVGIYSVAVNPDVLAAAGVEMPDDTTWTWDDLREISAQVTQNSPEGTYGFDRLGLAAVELGYFARQRGEEVFPREGETPVSVETALLYLDHVDRLEADGAVPSATVQNEDFAIPLDSSMFGTGQAAFHLLFHTQMQAFANAAGTEMQLLRLPALEAGEPHMANKASMYWSIAARSDHPEEAATLVDFLLTDTDAARVLLVERGVSAIPAIQDEVEPLLDANGQTSLQFARAMQEEVITPPQVTPAGVGNYSSEYTRIMQTYMYDQVDRQTAAQQLVDLARSVGNG